MENYSYCLYIKHNDRNCTDINVPENTAIIDIDQMSEKPSWLRGIPTVVKLSDGSLYEGINAIYKLKDVCQKKQAELSQPIPSEKPVIENNRIQQVREETNPKTSENDIQQFLDARKSQDKRLGFMENQ